jgi:membrane-bound lytic murein transglycosylase B
MVRAMAAEPKPSPAGARRPRVPRGLWPALLAALLVVTAAAEAAQRPSAWVASFWPTARAAGVSRATFDRALGDFEPDEEVIKNASTQAEFQMKIWDYMEQMVSQDRLDGGRQALIDYADVLKAIEARYGVDHHVVVAIWGMESHYGAVFTNTRLYKSTVRSLATLAWAGGRLAGYARTQLVAALKILERGDVDVDGMRGSWAGAMGQTQFIPTTFEAYGVDFDGDGHRNIWTSAADALASTANLLRRAGWRSGQTWGYEVIVPARSTAAGERTLAEWSRLGFRRVGGQDFPRLTDSATLYRPNGANGPSFLLLKNFSVIKRYNNSNSYALAVGHLSDRLEGSAPFATPWPAHEIPLSQAEREKLQLLLTLKGHYAGDIDGVLGSGSREAIRNYQLSVGIKPDGVGSRGLLQRLESGG